MEFSIPSTISHHIFPEMKEHEEITAIYVPYCYLYHLFPLSGPHNKTPRRCRTHHSSHSQLYWINLSKSPTSTRSPLFSKHVNVLQLANPLVSMKTGESCFVARTKMPKTKTAQENGLRVADVWDQEPNSQPWQPSSGT